MKICLLCYRGNPYSGGQGVYIHYLSRALRELGHEVCVVVGPPYPDIAPGVSSYQVEGLNLFTDSGPRFLPTKPSQLLNPLNFYEWMAAHLGVFSEPFTFSLRAYHLLRRLQPQYKFDIIHDNQCLGYGLLLMKTLKVPIVATLHHPIPIDRETALTQARSFREKYHVRAFYSFWRMQSLVIRRMDRVITVSKSSAQEAERVFKLPQSKLRVVHNGIDTNVFKRQDDISKGSTNLIMVGNTEDRRKGVLYLLQALHLLKGETKVNLTIVDKEGPEAKYAPALVKEYGLESMITLTGRISLNELVKRYSAAEVAVVPALYEGFGLPAAEAMACELPVITTRGGALPEVVGEDGEAGILVPPGDPHALAAAIKRLLADPELRRKMGEVGRKRVETHFTWEEAAKKTVEVYQEVL